MLLEISVYDSIMPRKGYYYILFSKIFDTDKDNLQQELNRLFEYAEKINLKLVKKHIFQYQYKYQKLKFPMPILIADNSKLELD